ncbi:hypothetical protein EDD86DRAFT_95692 [Gorgonomyces haynaldii]|nr:hypothetical protein EDD86DRAFT_95692 [Gorgonomyces haynaldii]
MSFEKLHELLNQRDLELEEAIHISEDLLERNQYLERMCREQEQSLAQLHTQLETQTREYKQLMDKTKQLEVKLKMYRRESVCLVNTEPEDNQALVLENQRLKSELQQEKSVLNDTRHEMTLLMERLCDFETICQELVQLRDENQNLLQQCQILEENAQMMVSHYDKIPPSDNHLILKNDTFNLLPTDSPLFQKAQLEDLNPQESLQMTISSKMNPGNLIFYGFCVYCSDQALV